VVASGASGDGTGDDDGCHLPLVRHGLERMGVEARRLLVDAFSIGRNNRE
jgi:hypothetical protein